ncbi:unnamed protein product [[Actinomadura] parvosata subsp. kistnae]|uniref:WXG100 family type VII secretion target n=1 Tax=[Actinomadura] parvosata subsp. kistnae TaxID=1909395 RepID=A0A1V0A5E8_9ACTN|nr:hypothetical protein BKM31_31510 [Nonomuraea sp. ATCC 55076]SPL96706.1 unnamed protein product [Actinomadura parvosata subsp. kistnae]
MENVKPDTRYLTPDAIGEVRRSIREELLPIFTEVRQIFEENKAVDFPGWGAVGEWTVGALYRSLLDSFLRDADAVLAVLGKWEGEDLKHAEQNWRTAEDLAVQRVKP